MKPMGPIPHGFSADSNGRLLLGGRAADELAADVRFSIAAEQNTVW